MTPQQVVFLVAGGVTLLAAIMVVTSPKLVHAGLWLILTLAGIAVLFITLENGFLAVVQVAVYIDAIAILIIIVVMLTRAVMKDTDPQINRVWIWAATAAVVMFGAMLAIISQVSDQTLPELINPETGLKILGRALVDVNGFVLPFEIASVLLVAAMIGAIVVARAPMGNE